MSEISMAPWRCEKAENIVEELCRLLQAGITDDQKGIVAIALHDALKLLADAMQELDSKRSDLWSPGLVKSFLENPAKCGLLLKMMAEPEFKTGYYNP